MSRHTHYAINVAVSCDYDSFCDECKSWTKDFRRMYMKHQRTLYLKRVSKENAKVKIKSPPVVDDAASTASIESHVCLPVVILPVDLQSVDTDNNLCNLGNIQNVDNVVEIQTQPEIPPPPLPPRILTLALFSLLLSDFTNYLINFRGVEPLHVNI